MRFLAPALPAAAWLAALALRAIPARRMRRLLTAAVVARSAVAALLVARLFFVDSRLLAESWMCGPRPARGNRGSHHQPRGVRPPGARGPHGSHRAHALARDGAGRALRAGGARLPGRGGGLAGADGSLLRALPGAPRAAARAHALLPRSARRTRGLHDRRAFPPGRLAASAGGVPRPRDRDPQEKRRAAAPSTDRDRARPPGRRRSGSAARRRQAPGSTPGRVWSGRPSMSTIPLSNTISTMRPGRSRSPGSITSARRPPSYAEPHGVELAVARPRPPGVAQDDAALEARLVHVAAELQLERPCSRPRRARRRAASRTRPPAASSAAAGAAAPAAPVRSGWAASRAPPRRPRS